MIGTTRSPDRFAAIEALGVTPRLLGVDQVDAMADLLADREAVLLSVGASRRDGDYRAVYLQAAQNLATTVGATPVRRIIYTSSTSVYHQNDGQWVDESSPAHPVHENGRILLETEQVLAAIRARTGGMNISIVRLAGIYGPGREIADFVRRAAGTTRRDGQVYLNMVHLDDIVDALSRLMGTSQDGVLNLADDHPIPRRSFYDRWLADLELEPVRWVAASSPALGRRVSNARIKRRLGWSPRHPRH